MSVLFLNKSKPVQGLSPVLLAANLVTTGSEHLLCGACGYNKLVTHYIWTDEPWGFEPVCYCPLAATLEA